MAGCRTFPRKFDLRFLEGSRAAYFQKPEDAFQQLVGDWCLTIAPTAQLSPTVGADGRIDIHLGKVARRPDVLCNAPVPLVVECKWHDDTSNRVADNVEAGWSKVARSLRKHADAGWPGLFAPWRSARGYIYGLSVTLTSQQARIALKQQITDFFASIPAAQRPPIGWVEVLDWENLRTAFDAVPSLRDACLGTGLDRIQDQATFEAGLTGFRAYLTEEKLPFLPPSEASETHPETMFRTLQRKANDRGVLLVGPGGVGKTRLTVEVTRLAHKNGWRVLHAAGSASISIDDIAVAALPGIETTPVLVVFDYLEQFQALDLGDLRYRLIPDAARRGGRVAFLASSRPGAAALNKKRWVGFFDTVNLTNDDARRSSVISSMITIVAPTACRRYGQDVVIAAAGQRPIIALLIAIEIEARQYRAGEQSIGPLLAAARNRPGDLRAWLESRLREDRLLPRDLDVSNSFLPTTAPPGDDLITAAAVLAAVPLLSQQLLGVAAKAWPGGATAGTAGRVCGHLYELGWLELVGSSTVSAHDVVADEVLAQCSIDLIGETVRHDVLEHVLRPGLSSPRVLGRFAVAFARTFSGAGTEDAVASSISGWLTDNLDMLSGAFLANEPDEVSYAIGALLASPHFAEPLTNHWDALINPWIVRYGAVPEAYHLLGRALRLVRHDLGALAGKAITAAFAWLDYADHGSTPEAQFVLHPLLGRDDLGAQADKAITAAFAWLDYADHGSTPEASHVLPPLLQNKDKTTGELLHSLLAAVRWLAPSANGLSTDASHVLKELMRVDVHVLATKLPGISAKLRASLHSIEEKAYLWIMARWREPDAEFLINRVLRRPVLADPEWCLIAARALWRMRFTSEISDDVASTAASLLSRSSLLRDATKLWLLQHYVANSLAGPGRAARLRYDAIQFLASRLSHIARMPRDQADDLPRQISLYVETHWADLDDRSLAVLLPPLLPLMHRTAVVEDIARVRALTMQFINRLPADSKHIKVFNAKYRKLYAAGAWPCSDEAFDILARFGASA